MRYQSLIIVHLILNILAFHLTDDLYFFLVASSWCLIPLFFLLNNYRSYLIWIWFAYTINNIVDELLKMGNYRSVSEYVYILLITFVIIKIKCQRKKF